MKRKLNIGFTLLELLISMVIFSFMSVMAYGGLVNILKSNEVIESAENSLKILKRTMMFFERDMQQLVLRKRRSGYDQSEFLPALMSGLDSEGVIEFTCAGVSNPMELVRSSLQRVRYDLQDNTLTRMSWKLVDHVNADPISMQLLDDVESFDLRFLSANNSWKDNWGSSKDLPIAVELILKHKSWGEIKRIIYIK